MDINIKNLSNGIELITCKNPFLHSVNIGFYFKAGPIYETKKTSGISHLLEHLFFRRINTLNQKKLYDSVNKIGANFRGATYPDFIRLDIEVSPLFFKQAFNIISNIMCDFNWSEDEINSEKAVVIKQIEFDSSPSFSERADRIYFKGTKGNMDIMGTVDSVKSFSSELINSWKSKIFNTSNLCCVITGAFSDENYDYAYNFFNSLDKSGSLLKNIDIIPVNFCKRTSLDDHILPSNDDISDVIISFDIDTTICDGYSAEMLSSILGGGDGSRLSMILREQLALTDEIYSQIFIYHRFSNIRIEFSAFNSDIIDCLNIMFDEIIKFKHQITASDLNTNIIFKTEDAKWDFDYVRDLNFDIGWQRFILNKQDIDMDKRIKAFKGLNTDDLMLTAQKIFKADNLSFFVTNNTKICKRFHIKNTLDEIKSRL